MVEAVLHRRLRAVVGDEDIRVVGQAPNDLAPLLVPEVDGQALLVAEDVLRERVPVVVEEKLGPPERPVVAHRIARGGLDMDHVGSHVAEEHPRPRPEVDVRPLDDPETAQRPARAHEAPSPPSAPCRSARHDMVRPARNASKAACRSGLPIAATFSSAAAAWLESRSCIVGPQRGLRQPHSLLGEVEDPLAELGRRLLERAGRDDARDETDLGRLRRIDLRREIEDLLGAAQADHEGEELRRSPPVAAADLRPVEEEVRGLVGEHEVGEEGHLGATSDAGSLDREDDGLAEADDDVRDADHPLEEVRPPGRLVREDGLGHLDVAARAERTPGAADDDDADRLVGTGFPQRLQELVVRLHAEGVELLGPVERDRRDAAVGAVAEVLVRRGRQSLLKMSDPLSMIATMTPAAVMPIITSATQATCG